MWGSASSLDQVCKVCCISWIVACGRRQYVDVLSKPSVIRNSEPIISVPRNIEEIDSRWRN